jgi:hypothetical protein
MNLSRTASFFETQREEQRKIKLFAPLSVSERGWGQYGSVKGERVKGKGE